MTPGTDLDGWLRITSSRAQFLSAGFSRLCWSARRLQPRAL